MEVNPEQAMTEAIGELIASSFLSFFPFLVFLAWMSFRVFRKAGRSGWWSILVLVPIVNIVMVWVFAFMRWPALEATRVRTHNQ